jgi:chromate transporter
LTPHLDLAIPRRVETAPTAPQAHPSFAEAFRFWCKLGWISFGGPAGQIAIMQTELVERKRWIGQGRFLHALSYCMLLPGPEATQLAIYVGWLLHKTRGGIVAGVLFVLPSVFILWTLSYVYLAFGHVPWIAAVFYGLKPAVTAIVLAAVVRIGRKALRDLVHWGIAAVAFVAIFFLGLPFPAIVLGAGLVGLVGGELWPERFRGGGGHGASVEQSVLGDEQEAPAHTRPHLGRSVRVLVICGVLWAGPTILAGAVLGWRSTLFQEGLFFSKAAAVTFGGAYAVLPYVAQQAVVHFGWLRPGQMLDGLGLAETTPGPLIMVVQFVGFVGAWQNPGGLAPVLAATLGALLTTWVTFAPCFLWIFLGGPYLEQLRGNRRLTSALSAITAAVVGVVLNLAVWFGLQVFFPRHGAIDWFALGLSALALAGLLRWRWNVIVVVAAGGLGGLLVLLLGGAR